MNNPGYIRKTIKINPIINKRVNPFIIKIKFATIYNLTHVPIELISKND